MPFLDDNFLLTNETARKLYHEVAAGQPIYDYHCHLSPADIAGDSVYDNLFEVWLEGDHYKWRAMRANGVDESLITGDADPYDKFLAWAQTVPYTLRNPLYHWTHLELRRYFGIDTLLSGETAKEIWDEANRQLKDLSTRAMLDKFKVALVGTTDDPADPLDHHEAIAKARIDTTVVPTFRPDKACDLTDLDAFNQYVMKLVKVSGRGLQRPGDLLEILRLRHDAFHAAGGRASDHGLSAIPDAGCNEPEFNAIMNNALHDGAVTRHERQKLTFYMMRFFAQLNHERGWAMQMHLGPIRNANAGLYQQLGGDIGCDSIGDAQQGPGLVRLLGELSQAGTLPKTVLYNVNPRDNYLFATMAGNYQGQGVPGRVQFGSGWWFLDQKEGMTWQLNALSNLGLLSRFVGMLTDSRSMMSFPRHEYFRRILCDLIGTDAENGELPDDFEMLSKLVADVCFNNARDYFGIALSAKYSD